MMVQQISGAMAFFKAMAPVLIASILTVTFVYRFAKISHLEQKGEDEGRLTYLRPRLLINALGYVGGLALSRLG